MKTKKLLLALNSLVGSLCYADSNQPLFNYVDDSTRTIYVASRPGLSVDYTSLEASDDIWGQLHLHLGYHGSDEDQVAALQRSHPGSTVKRITTSPYGKLHLEVLPLAIVEDVPMVDDLNGAYLDRTWFISKKDSEKILNAMASGSESIVQITGQMTPNIPIQSRYEKVELDHSSCDQLLKGATDVLSVLKNFGGLLNKIEQSGAQLESTRKALIGASLETCLEFESAPRVSNFSELLSLKVRARGGAGRIVGESKVPSPSLVPFDLRYSVNSVSIR